MINNQLFASRGYLEAGVIETQGGVELNLTALPPFLRVILATDGTVTKCLEAYFWEPTKVVILSQYKTSLWRDEPELNLTKGDEILNRKANIVGKHTGTIYVQASSLIGLASLPEKLRQSLFTDDAGIGISLREIGAETSREILAIDHYFHQDASTFTHIERRYRIVMNRTPFARITERYPISSYATL